MDHRPGDAPPLPLFLTEPGRAVAELGLYFAMLPALLALPRGDGHPVLVLPGLLADDTSTSALRAVLRRLGYAVYGWRLGRNIGPTATCVDGLRTCVSDLAHRHGRAVSLIGWSLGGIFAREQARALPGSVRQVITLASPFRLARPGQTRARRAFERYSHLHVTHPDLPLERDGEPLPVPATSVYSRLDGIVAWESCLGTTGGRSENIAVLASHLGIGHHPAAVYAVADRLAQAETGWQPFRPPPVLRPAFPRPDQPASPPPARTP